MHKLCLCMFFFSSFLLWLSHHFLFHSCGEHNSHFQSFPQMFRFLNFHLLFPKYTQVVSGLFACVCFCVCVCVCMCMCVFYCDCQMCILIIYFLLRCFCCSNTVVLALCQNVVIIGIGIVSECGDYWKLCLNVAITDNCVRIWWLLVLCQNVVITENCVSMWWLLIIVLEYGGYWYCVRMWRLLIIVLEYGGYWYCVRMWRLLIIVLEYGGYWYCVRMWRLLIIVLEYGGYWYCVKMFGDYRVWSWQDVKTHFLTSYCRRYFKMWFVQVARGDLA